MRWHWLKSLRLRLLAGILITLMLSWLVPFTLYWSDAVREQTGSRDRDLASTAQVALLSMTPVLLQNDRERFNSVFGHRWLSKSRYPLQVFDAASGTLLFRTGDAPTVAIAEIGEAGFSTKFVDGEAWRVYAMVDSELRLQVAVGTSLVHGETPFGERLRLGSFAALLLVLSIGGAAVLISSMALRPVGAITEALRRRDITDLGPLDEERVPIEIKPLIMALNQQHARLQAVLDNERRFLGDVAHELRTPLAVLTVQIENTLRTDDRAEVRALLHKMAETTQRSARLSEQLLDLTRLESGEAAGTAASVDLEALVEMVAQDIAAVARTRDQRLVLDLAPCRVVGYVDSLGILVRNLLDNACRYSGPGCSVLVQCRQQQGCVQLTVMDDGPGVPAADLPLIFERFYRVSGSIGHGSGIGLSLVARIAAQHRATVEVSTGIGGQGVAISVMFPGVPGA
jgi:signal transduction histidine kinase